MWSERRARLGAASLDANGETFRDVFGVLVRDSGPLWDSLRAGQGCEVARNPQKSPCTSQRVSCCSTFDERTGLFCVRQVVGGVCQSSSR